MSDEKWLREDCLVYALDADGTNLWWANVYSNRLTEGRREAIAALIASAPELAAENARLRQDLADARATIDDQGAAIVRLEGELEKKEREKRGALTALECSQDRADRLQADLERSRGALERIHDMSERPTCLCGRPTGTAAIKACARAALQRPDGEGERKRPAREWQLLSPPQAGHDMRVGPCACGGDHDGRMPWEAAPPPAVRAGEECRMHPAGRVGESSHVDGGDWCASVCAYSNERDCERQARMNCTCAPPAGTSVRAG